MGESEETTAAGSAGLLRTHLRCPPKRLPGCPRGEAKSSDYSRQAVALRSSPGRRRCNRFLVWVCAYWPPPTQDAFNGIGEDDAPMMKTNENENELKELRTFTDLIHSKNKVGKQIEAGKQGKNRENTGCGEVRSVSMFCIIWLR